tara:strand:- start:407 stop:589 length:183 start_codon:yes stop_codon:yes gene_type:complete
MLLLFIALRLAIKHIVSVNRDCPEDVEMTANEHHPMKDKFSFLLRSYLGARVVHSYATIL